MVPLQAKAATFECSIEPRLRLKLAAPIDGVLEQLLVDRGAHVHKGDVVAKLNAEVDEATAALDKAVAENQAEVASWSARVEYLKLQQERASKLVATAAGTQERLDDANGNLQVAQSGLLNARERRSIASLNYERAIAIVKQKSISSPIDGIVFEHLLGPGEYAYHDRSPIIVIDQLDPLNVQVRPPVTYYGMIRPGMKATVRPEKPISGEHQAEVEVVDSVLDSQNNSFGVRLKLPNPEEKIPAGLRCLVEFPEITPNSSPPSAP